MAGCIDKIIDQRMVRGGDLTLDEYVVCRSSSSKYLALGIEKDISESIGDGEYGASEHPRYRNVHYCPMSIPKAGVAMAVFLTVGGAYLMIYGFLVLTGFCVPKHTDGMWFRVALGLLTFIPGVYHVRLALFAYLEVPGFSFEDFPEFW